MGRGVRTTAMGALALLATTLHAGAASAYLFWKTPDFHGPPVKGDEPGIVLAMPGATDKEIAAALMWGLRAGLNVAALKCQFAPILATVPNYNAMLTHHARELNAAYVTVQGYFKRTGGKTWQTTFDQYTTRTYNGFSTFNGEQGFCETAATIGRDALAQRKGALHVTAENHMREFRNSLAAAGDQLVATRPEVGWQAMPSLDRVCWNKKDEFVEKKCALPPPPATAGGAAIVPPPADGAPIAG